ncbi:threonine-phosphate decarboxylase CobD [Pseudoduganella sp. S-14]|uniref:threonine-phosphate decarboxylase CobD n=1 Tax=Pseudoduganella sp. S-14 TaxID=3404065 RepID=UPI003CEDC3ED
MLEHGGKLREAAQRYGRNDWLDLSTGLNPGGYPAPALAPDAWHRLPEHDPALLQAAQCYYRAPRMLAVAGTQAAIQALPRLRAPSRVVVASPSYAEHLHHWSQHGHRTSPVPYSELDAAVATAGVVVVCNPNNPTGAFVPRTTLLQWAEALATRGGWLVVDEAFADTDDTHSLADATQAAGLVVLRSVGKFFGLAGLRLGFVAARDDILAPLADMLGPWAVSGPAQQVARAALEDRAWQGAAQEKLHAAGTRLRALLASHGIVSNGTSLFQWWPEPLADEFHDHMARRGIWVRLFREAARGIRLGLPPDETGWQRLELALNEWMNR